LLPRRDLAYNTGMKIVNRQARHNYHILETLEAGVMLSGIEVKSIRSGRADMAECFARIQNNEVYIKNLYIPSLQPIEEYNPRRDRKLLLHRNQIQTLIGKVSKSTVTLIPLSLYTSKNYIKVELALAASKKQYDKRKALKEKDEQRKLDIELRGVKE
jgi:SsrA-binding protein